MSASRAERKETRENVLQEFVRYSIRAAQGLGGVAEEEGRDLIRKMVDVKRISPIEGEKLVENLMHRMQISKGVFEKRVRATVSEAFNKLSSISSREISSINERIESLDRRIASLAQKRNMTL